MKNKKIILFIFVVFLILGLLLYDKRVNYSVQKENDRSEILPSLSSRNLVMYKWNYTWGDIDSEYAWDIALDSSDNIYLAGYTNGTVAGDEDMCLVKFNNLGEYQWNRTWGGSVDERGQAIALDSSNNIYLAGTWDADDPNPDMCLVKFNNLGEYQWNRTWGGSNWEECIGIELDSSGNIYLGGSQATSGGKYEEFCLVKYDSTGQYQWNRTWGGNQDDNAHTMAMDSSENIYLAGYMWNEFYISDACLVKFNNLGDYQWNSTWGKVYDDEHPYGIAFDKLGNIYITGWITNESMTISDNFLVKYDSTGIYQWNHTWGEVGLDYAMAIASDSLDNIYIAGGVSSITKDLEMFLIQYDTSGVQQWNHTWGGNEADVYTAIALDSSENLYLAGLTFSYGAGNVDMCLVKYDNIIPEININTPENTTYTGPMSGYYPATYGFENDASGGDPAEDWEHNLSPLCSINIVDSYMGHNKVYEIFDNNEFAASDVHTNFENQSYGTIEYWTLGKSLGNWTDVYIMDRNVAQQIFRVDLTPGTYLRSWNGTGYVVYEYTEFGILNADEWYHIRVDFRSAGAASYMGLSEDSFRVYLNGVPANTELSFTSVSNSVNQFLFQSGYSAYGSEFYSYLDAVGFSWNSDYNVGDNFNEGLLLSFTPDDLDWMVYSLDGQSNRTILGNTTIPFPDDGDHTIQLFGNSSLVIIYQSNILHFSVDTIAPISDILFTPCEGVNKVNKSTTFILTADDGIGSGVSTIMYKINNSGWIPYTVPFDLSTYDYGYYLITYYAIDIVGNVEDENALLVELIEIPSKPSKPKISGYNILLLIGLTSIVSILLTKRFLKNKD